MTKGVFEKLYLFKRDLFFFTCTKLLTGENYEFCIPRERLPSVQRAIDRACVRFWTDLADKHFHEWASLEREITFRPPRESGWLDFTETPFALAWGDDPGFVIGDFYLTDVLDPSLGGHTAHGWFWVSADRWKDWYSLQPTEIEIYWFEDVVNFRSVGRNFDNYVRTVGDPLERQGLQEWVKKQARNYFINTKLPVVENRRPDRGVKTLKGGKKRHSLQCEPAFSVIVKRRPEIPTDANTTYNGNSLDSGRLPNILHVVSEFTRMQWYPSEKVHRPVVIKEFLRGTDDPARQRPTQLVKVAR